MTDHPSQLAEPQGSCSVASTFLTAFKWPSPGHATTSGVEVVAIKDCSDPLQGYRDIYL